MSITRTTISIFSSESVSSGAATLYSSPVDVSTARSVVLMLRIENQSTLTWPGIMYVNARVDEGNSGTYASHQFHVTQMWGNLVSGSYEATVCNIPPAAEWIEVAIAAPSGGSIYADASVVLVTEIV